MKVVAIGNKAFTNLVATSGLQHNFTVFGNHRDSKLLHLIRNARKENEDVLFLISQVTESKDSGKNLEEGGFTLSFPFITSFVEKIQLRDYRFILFSFLQGIDMPAGLIQTDTETKSTLCALPIESKEELVNTVNGKYNSIPVTSSLNPQKISDIYNHELKCIQNNLSANKTSNKQTKLMSFLNVKEANIVIPILDDEETAGLETINNLLPVAERDFQSLHFPYFPDKNTFLEYLKHGSGLEMPNEKNTDVQAILLDWVLSESIGNDEKVIDIIKEIRKIRPNIHIYILTRNENYHSIIDQLLLGLSRSEYQRINYYVKGENYPQLWEAIKRDIKERQETPFWNAYKNYALNANFSWHTPGHSGGNSFRNSDYLKEFYNFFGDNVFKGDLSVSVDELGSLFSGTGKVQEAQKYAAKVFGTKHTFFVTNGSSTANKILLQFILRPGDKAIVDRNCHKSVHYALIHGNYNTVYLNSEYSDATGFFAPPAKDEIKAAVLSNMSAKVLVLTGCTYDGIMMNLKDIITSVKEINPNIKVMIDEAWFCYSSFHYAYEKYSALRAGADYVTHSAHKVLSAFSQASYIHVNDPGFDQDALQFFMEAFCNNTSTSPQYNLIASLEIAALQMEMEGFKIIDKIRHDANTLITNFNSKSTKIKILTTQELLKKFQSIKSDDKCAIDPLKIVIDFSNSGLELSYIQQQFRQANIQVEKSTRRKFVLLLYTIGTSYTNTGNLYQLLTQLDKEAIRISDINKKPVEKKNEENQIKVEILKIEHPSKGFHYYFYSERKEYKTPEEILELINDNKEVFCCHLLVPYPPGIPILIPGSKIDKEKCEYIQELLNAGNEVHGIRNRHIAIMID